MAVSTFLFSLFSFDFHGLHRGPEGPAAHFRICLALLPSGPDAVRRLKLHRFRTAVQPATAPPRSGRQMASVLHGYARREHEIFRQHLADDHGEEVHVEDARRRLRRANLGRFPGEIGQEHGPGEPEQYALPEEDTGNRRLSGCTVQRGHARRVCVYRTL